jgi:carotenoid 1,2-hydratase
MTPAVKRKDPRSMQGAPHRGPRFDLPVPPDGYGWWYLDATSDDGRHGLTVIAFVGSVFSPFYASARRRGPAAATDHCAINVALYGATTRWAMTERDGRAIRRTADTFDIGTSRLRWLDDCLVIDVDERTVPWPGRLRGTITVHAAALTDFCATLDGAGRHRWQPIAPHARVDVDFGLPALRWSGHGYVDSNNGDEPLEAGFRSWHWSRARQPDGTTRVYYDAERRDGTALALALEFDRNGNVRPCEAPPSVTLPPTMWRIERRIRGTDALVARVRTVEDTPFYARSMAMSADPAAPQGVHESLSLERFSSRWVQTLLPFRMRRERWRRHD